MEESIHDSKHIFIIAGLNGAGKTTFANSFIPITPIISQFVNADLIAAGLFLLGAGIHALNVRNLGNAIPVIIIPKASGVPLHETFFVYSPEMRWYGSVTKRSGSSVHVLRIYS